MGRVRRLIAAAALVLALAGWSKPQQLETEYVPAAEVKGDGHGHRVAAWIAETGVRVALADRGRDFGPVHTITGGEDLRSSLQLVVGPRGDALVVWLASEPGEARPENDEDCCSAIHAALVRRDGRVIGPVTVSRTSTVAREVVVTAGSRGRFAIAWTITDPESRFARVGSIRRGLGPVESVPGRGVNAGIVFNGRRVRVQSVVDYVNLQEVTRNEAGRWSGPRSLLHDRTIETVELAADGRGRQVGVLHTSEPPYTRIGVRTPPGRLALSDLVPGSDGPFSPLLAVARSGAAALVWQEYHPPSFGGDIHLRGRRPGRRFGPDQLVYESPSEISVLGTSVAPDGSTVIGMEVGQFPNFRARVVLVRPSGGVRRSDVVWTGAARVITDVYADSHGAVAVLQERETGRGIWASRSH